MVEHVIAAIPIDSLLLTIMKVVQVIAGFGVLLGIGIAIYSLWLQKKEVMKQNKTIINLLEQILKK